MQHPDLTSQLARERQDRYRADAGRRRLTRPAPSDEGRIVRRATTQTDSL